MSSPQLCWRKAWKHKCYKNLPHSVLSCLHGPGAHKSQPWFAANCLCQGSLVWPKRPKSSPCPAWAGLCQRLGTNWAVGSPRAARPSNHCQSVFPQSSAILPRVPAITGIKGSGYLGTEVRTRIKRRKTWQRRIEVAQKETLGRYNSGPGRRRKSIHLWIRGLGISAKD